MWAPGFEHLNEVYANGVPADAVIISTQKEGNVYRHNEYVIKERTNNAFGEKVCNDCVKREAEIGLIANKYNSPYLVKTIGYFEHNNISYLVTEYIHGKSLYQLLNEGARGLSNIYKLLLLAVFNLQEVMNFTHYDLHSLNVIVTEGQSATYYFGDHSFTTNHMIKIIDLARAHVKGITSGWVESGVNDTATTPGVYDPLFDIARIFTDIESNWGHRLKVDLKPTLALNGFSVVHDNLVRITGYPRDYEKVHIMKLLTGRTWASTTAGELSFREVERMYAETIIGMYYEYGGDPVNLVDIMGIGLPPQYNIKYIMHPNESQSEKFLSGAKNHLLNNMAVESLACDITYKLKDIPRYEKTRDFYLKLLGAAAVNDKLKQISRYVNTPAELVALGIKAVSFY